MESESTQPLKTGDLSIYADSGEVRNSRGVSVRLGPVNMRILALLTSRAGDVVLRKELFEEAWKNQTVSDDALTRCISDIRAALNELSENNQYIETLPKRGYRWNASDLRMRHPSDNAATGDLRQRESTHQRVLAVWIRQGLMYLAALGITASFGIWLIDKLARPAPPIVVMMPAESDSSQSELAASIEQQLSEYLLGLDQVDLLSRTAVQSRPTNPFPYFHYEFGARWLIESKLRVDNDESILSIILVDARAGIVLLQLTERIPNRDGLADTNIEETLEPLRDYIGSQQGL